MRRILITLSLMLSLLTVAGPAFAQQAMKIAVVDFQRALNETAEGKKARSTLETRFEKTRVSLEADRAELEQKKQNLEAQAVMLSPQALATKQQDYNAEAMAFQQRLVESQQEMATMEQELTGDILTKLSEVANAMSQEQGYTLVVEATAVVFSDPSLDITEQVITRYNAAHK